MVRFAKFLIPFVPLAMACAVVVWHRWTAEDARFVGDPTCGVTYLESAEVYAKQAADPNYAYQPPQLDHRVDVYQLRGEYYVGWEGCGRWFGYHPSKAVARGELLEITLCLGPGSEATYWLRPEYATGKLAFCDAPVHD